MSLSVIAAAPTIHHEAIDWATRASANGGTVSTTVLRAVSDFCAAIDRSGVRSSIYRLNLFAGGTLSGCLVPLYRSPAFGGTVLGNSNDTNVNFVSADFAETGASGGLKGNGSNKYLNTGFTTNSLPSATSMHVSFSATGLGVSGSPVFIGTYNNTAAGMTSVYEWNAGVAGRPFFCGTTAGSQVPSVSSPGTSETHFIGSRASATSASIYRGGSLAASNATSITPTQNAIPFMVFVLPINLQPAAGFYSAARGRMYSIGSGLDATQAAAFSAAVINFNAALGR